MSSSNVIKVTQPYPFQLYFSLTMRRFIEFGNFLLIVSLILLTACKPDVTSIHPTRENISESVYASGIVKSKNQYHVYSTVNGVISEILVKEGDLVKSQTPLVKIYNKASLLTEENARLNAAYATSKSNQKKLLDLALAVDFAKAKMLNDSLFWLRKKNLWAQNIGTQVDLEQAEVTYKSAIVSYQSARTQYSELKRQLELNEKQAKNNFEISRTLTQEFTIESMIDGKVYSLLKEPGELVTQQTPVALLGDAIAFYLELRVDEYDIIKIKQNQEVYITMDSYTGEVFEATVTRINPIMNERDKSFTIEAEFTKSPKLLYPFLTVEANILIQYKEKVVTIPRNYLVEDNYVMLKNGTLKEVIIGLKDYQKVEIVKGLTETDEIIKPIP